MSAKPETGLIKSPSPQKPLPGELFWEMRTYRWVWLTPCHCLFLFLIWYGKLCSFLFNRKLILQPWARGESCMASIQMLKHYTLAIVFATHITQRKPPNSCMWSILKSLSLSLLPSVLFTHWRVLPKAFSLGTEIKTGLISACILKGAWACLSDIIVTLTSLFSPLQ